MNCVCSFPIHPIGQSGLGLGIHVQWAGLGRAGLGIAWPDTRGIAWPNTRGTSKLGTVQYRVGPAQPMGVRDQARHGYSYTGLSCRIRPVNKKTPKFRI
jgi:hypothetical protein